MKRKLMIFITSLVLCITLIGCTAFMSGDDNNTSNVTNNIHNNVTNEITNKVVNYENITVEGMQSALQTSVKRVENACVAIVLKNVTYDSNYGTSEDVLSYGSGVIYKAEEVIENGKLVNYKYYVITNRHVIDGDGRTNVKPYVYIDSEDIEIEAKVLGFDNKIDIAVLSFEHYTYYQPVEFGDSDSIEKGAFVFAVGNPAGLEYYGSVTLGVVSSPLRYLPSDTDDDGVNDFYGKYIQHDASINPGNSGGGLFTIDGKLLGINTLKIVHTGIENMGFSIPSNQVKVIVEDYLEKGLIISRPTLGIKGYELRQMTPLIIYTYGLKEIPNIYLPGEKQYGLYVNEFVVGGTLYNSGIKIHDIVLAIDGIKIKESSQLSALLNDLSEYTIGKEVTITYYSRSTNSIIDVKVVLKK